VILINRHTEHTSSRYRISLSVRVIIYSYLYFWFILFLFLFYLSILLYNFILFYRLHIYTLIIPTSSMSCHITTRGHCILAILIRVCFSPNSCCFTVPVHPLYFTVASGFSTMVLLFYSPIVYYRYDRFCFTMLFTYCVSLVVINCGLHPPFVYFRGRT
jgi:hypothetical protein